MASEQEEQLNSTSTNNYLNIQIKIVHRCININKRATICQYAKQKLFLIQKSTQKAEKMKNTQGEREKTESRNDIMRK